jgi:[ribosomal protein S18]-alanine N-acetyltransferase
LNNTEYTLCPASLETLRMVLAWIETPDQLKRWGGPALTFPPQVNRTWQEMEATCENTFSLLDPENQVVGFGQTLYREPDSVHLGRIMIAPNQRGKGLGRILCLKLIRAGLIHCQPAQFTLNVYQDNPAAIRLYKSLEFSVISENVKQNSFKMALALPFSPELESQIRRLTTDPAVQQDR